MIAKVFAFTLLACAAVRTEAAPTTTPDDIVSEAMAPKTTLTTMKSGSADYDQVGDDNTKCSNLEDSKVTVTDLAACEALARAAGDAWMSYSTSNSQCMHGSSCTKQTGTGQDWKVYYDVSGFAQVGGDNTKCVSTLGMADEGYDQVAGSSYSDKTFAACVALAQAAGDAWMSYKTSDSNCWHGPSCNDKTAVYPFEGWKVYYDQSLAYAQVGDDDTTCTNLELATGSGEAADYPSFGECEALARAAGSAWMNYNDGDRKCMHGSSCTEETGTGKDWKVYYDQSLAYAQVGGDNTNCSNLEDSKIGDTSFAACVALAQAAGSTWISYSEENSNCMHGSSCTEETGTGEDWKVYYDPSLAYAQVGSDNTKCSNLENRKITDTSFVGCVALAQAAGDVWMSYTEENSNCMHGGSCTEETGTGIDWKVYSDQMLVYAQVGDNNTKCSNLYSDQVTVTDLRACVALAQAAGDAWMSYTEENSQCQHGSSCTEQTGTWYDWKVYKDQS